MVLSVSNGFEKSGIIFESACLYRTSSENPGLFLNRLNSLRDFFTANYAANSIAMEGSSEFFDRMHIFSLLTP